MTSRWPGRPAEKIHKILLQQHHQQPTDDDDDDDDFFPSFPQKINIIFNITKMLQTLNLQAPSGI